MDVMYGLCIAFIMYFVERNLIVVYVMHMVNVRFTVHQSVSNVTSVCLHACIYACMHACMYLRMYVCMHVCMFVCFFVCMYVGR